MVVADQREAPHSVLPPFILGKVFFFPPLTRPASIRTLVGAGCSGASWSPQSHNGCCHLSIELSRLRCRRPSFRRDLAVTRTRRGGWKNYQHLRPPASS